MPQKPRESALAKTLGGYTRKYQRRPKVRPKRGLPKVRPAPSLQPSPLVLGSDTARYLEQLRAISPRILEGVSSVSSGPTSARIALLLKENPTFLGRGRRALPSTNILGQFDRRTRSVYLHPGLRGRQLFSTLAHELSHGAGANEESADRISGEAMDFYNTNLSPRQARRERAKRTRDSLEEAVRREFANAPWRQRP